MYVPQNDYMKEQFAHQPTKEMFETIYEIAEKQKYKNALEVGVAWAISTIAILSAGKGSLLSIDKAKYKNTNDQISLHQFTNRWIFIEEPSEEALPVINDKFDLICIDGYHKYEWVIRDLENAVRLLTDDGVIIVDDYNHKYNFDKRKDDYGVHQAVDELVKKYNLKLKIYNKANGIVEMRKK
jgi:predicted O-methyltransferase YrrM